MHDVRLDMGGTCKRPVTGYSPHLEIWVLRMAPIRATRESYPMYIGMLVRAEFGRVQFFTGGY